MKNKKLEREKKLGEIWLAGCICTITIPWSILIFSNIITLFGNEEWRNDDENDEMESTKRLIGFIYVFSLLYFILLCWYGNAVLKSSSYSDEESGKKKSWLSNIFRNSDDISEEKQINKTLGFFAGATVTFAYFSFLLFIFVSVTMVRFFMNGFSCS